MIWFSVWHRALVEFGLILSLFSSIAAAQPSAAAPDCSRAKSAVEKAICVTPELTAADAAMAQAYAESAGNSAGRPKTSAFG